MKQTDKITNAFTALRGQMLSLAERITGNSDDAADAVQEAFVKLWMRQGQFTTDSHARGAGIMAVRNTSIDMARRSARRENIPAEAATADVAEPTEEDRHDAYRQVRLIIDNELTQRQRAIIDWREVDEMEFSEIAERLNMTAANVRVELSRARKRVREIYRNRLKES